MLPTLSKLSVFFLSYWLLLLHWGRQCAEAPPRLGADPIGDAVAAGSATRHACSLDARQQARMARDEAFAGGNPSGAIGILLSLVREHPSDEVLQRIAARVLSQMGGETRAVRVWEGILARFPDSREAFIGMVRAVTRQSGPAMARRLIAAQCPNSFDGYVTIARAWDAMGNLDEASIAFESLITLFEERDVAWWAAISRLEAIGFYRQATVLLSRAAVTSRRPRQYCDRLAEVNSFVDRLPSGVARPRQRRSLAVLSGLLSDLVAARNEVVPLTHAAPRSVAMVIGGLGAGGAERQLFYTARGLQTLPANLRPRIIVVAASCRSRKNDEFFRPQLELAGVRVFEYEELPLFGGRFATSVVREVVQMLRFLPARMLESVLRLSDALRQWRPGVVQIWQEPTVFEAGIAALLARVPRIILCLRSVPAIDRLERYRPEYPVIFNALLAANNVDLSCNSGYAAARYSQWLGIDPARITVIPNGAEQLDTGGDNASEALFREFEVSTGSGGPTIGAIMRMDENKQVLLWVEAAAHLLQRLPSARFVLVGDGSLRRQATRWVAQCGIAERFLFVGISRYVGFWLGKMDLFMLLSKEEGLPNALIEAQLSGVPVLTTPAGGAPETMVPGLTGIVTEPNPSADEVAAHVLSLVNEPDRLRQMGEAGAQWVSSAFSMPQMVRRTLALMGGT